MQAIFGAEEAHSYFIKCISDPEAVYSSLRPSGCLDFGWQGSHTLPPLFWAGPLPVVEVSLGLTFFGSLFL